MRVLLNTSSEEDELEPDPVGAYSVNTVKEQQESLLADTSLTTVQASKEQRQKLSSDTIPKPNMQSTQKSSQNRQPSMRTVPRHLDANNFKQIRQKVYKLEMNEASNLSTTRVVDESQHESQSPDHRSTNSRKLRKAQKLRDESFQIVVMKNNLQPTKVSIPDIQFASNPISTLNDAVKTTTQGDDQRSNVSSSQVGKRKDRFTVKGPIEISSKAPKRNAN